MAESILARTRTVYKKLGGNISVLTVFLYLTNFIVFQAFRTLRKLTYKSSEQKTVWVEMQSMSHDCQGWKNEKYFSTLTLRLGPVQGGRAVDVSEAPEQESSRHLG